MTAYTCDGDNQHHITFAQWFFKGNVTNNTVDLTNAGGAHLVATFTSRAATGTVTLPDGKSFPFTANAITDPASKAGLYRSELTVGGVSYLAGWIVPTEQALNPLSTPTAFVGGLFAPAEDLVRSCCHECCMSGGIINERTKQLLAVPRFFLQDLTAGQVVVPNVGTFALAHCRDGQCS